MRSGFGARYSGKLLPYLFQARSNRYWLTIIILAAIMLRLVAAFYMGDRVIELPGTFDQISYDMLAQRVLAGHGFTVPTLWWPITKAGEPTAHWSYLYTLYLVAVYAVSGYHPLVARLIQAVLAGFLMPWLAYRLGLRHFNRRVGLVAAGLMAIYIYFVYYSAALMTETFYIIAILWTLDLAGQLGQGSTRILNSTRKVQWLLLGLALSVAVLLRQVFLLFIPVLFGWLLWRSYRYQSRPILHMLGILLGATGVLLLAIAPWTFRNYRAFDQFVLLNTNAGFAFFWGNHPIHGYNFISILPADGPSYQDLIPPELRDFNEAELDRTLLKLSLTSIQTDPVRYFVLSVSRIKDYFKFWPSSESSLISNLSRVFSFGLLWPFMAMGLIFNFRPSFTTETLLLYLFVVTYTGIHLISWALIRYRLPVDAILLIFASVAFVRLQVKLARRYTGPQNTYIPSPARSGD